MTVPSPLVHSLFSCANSVLKHKRLLLISISARTPRSPVRLTQSRVPFCAKSTSNYQLLLLKLLFLFTLLHSVLNSQGSVYFHNRSNILTM